MRRNALLPALGLILAACTATSGPPDGGIPVRLSLVTAPPASTASGAVLSPGPVIQVVDAAGDPVASRGILVTVVVATGGGTLTGTVEIRTDANGRSAFADLVLAGAAGPRTLRFTAAGLAAAASGTIDLVAGPVAQAAIQAGNNQTAAAGTALPTLPSVVVTDGQGNPVSGVSVTFSVAAGGGTVTGEAQTTGSNGIATIGSWTLGTAVGLNRLEVTVNGIAGTAVVFSATGVVGPAAKLVITAGNGQSATIGTAVATAPAVRVTDGFDNPVAGLAITYAVASGGGTLTGGTAIANAQGVATLGSWRLGLNPGANTITASRAGVPAVTFDATATHFQASAVGAGGVQSCAVSPADIRCWGDNTNGQLGSGTFQPDSAPVIVTGSAGLGQVTSGTAHACALDGTGAAWCWGLGSSGQLGRGSGANSNVPVAVIGGVTFTALSAGAAHTCGLKTDGTVHCWGLGANGRLGYGGTTSLSGPIPVAGGHTFSAVSAGGAHTCGLRTDGAILCWGAGASGRLGDGTGADRLVPTAVAGAGPWGAVSAGGSHTCALDATGAGWCWGAGGSGQLGTGTDPAAVLAPTLVSGILVFTAVSAGGAHTCAVATGGAGHCWGSNGSGRLGEGTTAAKNIPTLIAGGLSWTSLSAAAEHTCGISAAGSALCWGRNTDGRLGDGSQVTRLTPVGVKSP